jgi:hypothetical protein
MAKSVTNKKIKEIDVTDRGATPTAASVHRVIEIAKMLSKGKSRQSVIDYAMSTYQINETQAKRYYSAATKYLLPEDMDEFRKGLIQANMERLEHIIEKCMEQGQWKVAREAIDSLNKMFGVTGGVQVGIQTDNENNTQQIVIKFNE